VEISGSVHGFLYLSLYRTEFQIYNSWFGNKYHVFTDLNPMQMILCKGKTV
jgi:hypothetical protein